MCDRNTVTVKIFGQEYSISGDMPREYIMRVADYVDGKMNEVAQGAGTISTSAAAVLAAANIADEYFSQESSIQSLMSENVKLKEDNASKDALWENAKQSLAQLREKDSQNAGLVKEMMELRRNNDVLRARVAELQEKLDAAEAPMDHDEVIASLESKCRDVESSFFDIQMENIHLKNELESLRRQLNR